MLIFLLAPAGCGGGDDDGQDRLVVYCAHDATYAEAILDRFEQQTGIHLAIRYDTEATKSLGLTELIIREKGQPRCDVFWNNQLLGTADLNDRGLLEPYQGAGFARIPDAHKDPGGAYVGFAARLRVYIVNTERMEATEAALRAALRGDLSRFAVAKPLFGTTLTHYTVLWHRWGPEKVAKWHHDWRRRNVVERGGNATVKNLVARGVCDLGLTDTDDFFLAVDEGKPVAMLPVRVGDAGELDASVDRDVEGGQETSGRGPVICIPNTVAIIKNANRSAAAWHRACRLVDYLLSEQVELLLASSKSRQIPLGPVDETKLPDDVKPLRQWARHGYPLTGLTADRSTCLAWLKSEYLQ